MLSYEIKELIEKDLPAQTSGVLRDYLKKAEAAIENYDALEKDLENTRKSLSKKIDEVSILTAQLQPQAEIENKKIDIGKRELEIDKTILTIKLEESEKRADAITGLAETVFKNRKMVIERFGSLPVAVDGGNGYMGMVQNGSTNETETRNEESKTKLNTTMTNITIKTLASGSTGNAYHISDGRTSLLIEAGIPIIKIKQGLKYRLSGVDGCLISHQHQ